MDMFSSAIGAASTAADLFGSGATGAESAGGSAKLMPLGQAPSVSFGQTLSNALENVNDLQVKSASMQRDYADGRASDLHTVMIAGEQATIALQLTAQIRNKIVDAYQEVMRISM